MTTVQWLPSWPNRPEHHGNNPFCRDTFLNALEDTGVCSSASGWQPHHLEISSNAGSIAFPAYLKSHSWGEYVFDWSWAHAYEQHHLTYYPKLVCAIPYTPSIGPRATDALNEDSVGMAAEAFIKEARDQDYSGCHLLFPDDATSDLWQATGWLERRDVQFHWHNPGYRDFDDFLDRFSSRKRKNLRKERKSILDQGLRLECFEGSQISLERLKQFYLFYHATYLKRGRHGYLNLEFFQYLLKTQPQTMVLFLAYRNDKAVAGALCFRDADTLYGRYWGSLEEFPNLHFEACYYQGIDYCIRHGLTRFDPGTQGEHKVARGFEPRITRSFHWLAHPEFNQAARRFCDEEAEMVEHYRRQMTEALPFKQLPFYPLEQESRQ